MSIEPTCEEWDEPLVYMKSIITLPDELSKYVPSNESLILVDQNMLGADFFPQHKTFPFMEHDGVFAGFPEDDKSAIQELERLRNQGANYILFTPTTFWCLDYYTGFNKYLRTMYDSIHESKNMVVFNINNITKV